MNFKALVKKFMPNILLDLRAKWLYKNKNSKFTNQNTEDVFTEIYKSNHWNSIESKSGKGSSITVTSKVIDYLNKLLIERKINSMIDIPCGDFNWMKNVNLNNASYLGCDIVQELIDNNKYKFGDNDRINFKKLDLINDPLPSADLIFCRDCLVHLSYADIKKSLLNIKKSNSKYLLMTTFPRHKINFDIVTGDWRPLNFQRTPFNLNSPIEVFHEFENIGENIHADKSLALYDIDKLLI